jgi:diguanylate cyclase (GGDEF)-like protein
LAYVDIDGLKLTNDTHGHACGDAVLVHFSSILVSALRSSDLVGRLGGDEFGIVLLHADEKQAESTCVRINNTLGANPLAWQDKTIPIRVAFGVVQLTDGMNAEAAIAAADAAMYRQKTIRR